MTPRPILGCQIEHDTFAEDKENLQAEFVPIREGFDRSDATLMAQTPGKSDTSDSWYRAPTKVRRRTTRQRPLWHRKNTREEGYVVDGNSILENSTSPRNGKRVDPLLVRFGLDTWKKHIHCYSNPPLLFTGPKSSCTHLYGCLPSLLGLFEKFWSPKLQRRIVRGINRYASEVIDEEGNSRGGI